MTAGVTELAGLRDGMPGDALSPWFTVDSLVEEVVSCLCPIGQREGTAEVGWGNSGEEMLLGWPSHML